MAESTSSKEMSVYSAGPPETSKQAASKPSYISPLLMSIGLFIHQSTRSHLLIDILSSLGVCFSYDQEMKSQQSVVVNQSVQELQTGLLDVDSGG